MQQLSHLDRVQRGALAQVVGDDPQVECALVPGVAADAPDEHVVLAGGVDRERIHRGAGIVEHAHARRGREQLPRPLGGEGLARLHVDGLRVPVSTGTRTHVALTRIDGSPRILRVSLISLRSSSV